MLVREEGNVEEFMRFCLICIAIAIGILTIKRIKEKQDIENLIIEYDRSGSEESLLRLNREREKQHLSNNEYLSICRQLYTRRARSGDAFAQLQIGKIAQYRDKKSSVAEHWYTLSANNGNVEAMYSLGLLYSKAENEYSKKSGVGYNPEKSFRYFLMAAEHGYGEAMWWVAGAYSDGEGTLQDSEKEFYWAFKGAEQNDVKCCLYLANRIYGWFLNPHYSLDKQVQTLYKVLSLGDRDAFEEAIRRLGHIFGDAYVRGSCETEYTNRQKATYCFTMAYIMNKDDESDWELMKKTGYYVSKDEFDELKDDVMHLRAHFLN